jgi:hypothetical protein
MTPDEDLFEHDLFISYPQNLDNENWVSALRRVLENRLGEEVSNPEIFMDKMDLTVGDRLETILPKLRKSATFLAVLSKVYFERPWCWKEIREFLRVSSLDNYQNFHQGLFPVLKKEIDCEELYLSVRKSIDENNDKETWQEIKRVLDLLFKNTLHINFFHNVDDQVIYYEPGDKHFREASVKVGNKIIKALKSRRYSKYVDGRIVDAYKKSKELDKEILEELDTNYLNIEEANTFVYIAEVQKSLSSKREEIINELTQHGYVVLPNLSKMKYYELSQEDVEILIRQDMERCVLSIHLVGDQYGSVPESFQYSVIELQYRAIAKYISSSNINSGFKQFVWSNPTSSMPREEDRQWNFYQELQDAQYFFKVQLNELKTLILDELSSTKKVAEFKEANQHKSKGSLNIYLISSVRDQKSIKLLGDVLFEEGYEIRGHIVETEDPSQEKEKNLEEFSKIIIFWGQENQSWIDEQIRKVNAESDKIIVFISSSDVSSSVKSQKFVFRTRKAQVVKEGGREDNEFAELLSTLNSISTVTE